MNDERESLKRSLQNFLRNRAVFENLGQNVSPFISVLVDGAMPPQGILPRTCSLPVGGLHCLRE